MRENTNNTTLGIDFGTSNSAMAWATPGGLSQPIALEGSATAMPTAVFYNAEERSIHYGREAVSLYLQGTEGRLLRSLKSLLGSALVHEQTVVHNTSVSFLDIITVYLAELRRRAGQALGALPQQVVLGRPVHFVDDDPERDALAQATLEQAARQAGFTRIAFQLEPIAAALDYERRVSRDTVVLIADIGGGTSDFTVVRLGPQRHLQADRSGDILATRGVHIGGTDFDQRLNLAQVMPLLGYRHAGQRGREVPSAVFFSLSTWHLINWLYAPKAMAEQRALRPFYSDTRLHDRLMRVLEERDGHRIANEVEAAKIRNSVSGDAAPVDLAFAEPGLQAWVDGPAVEQQLQPLLARVVAAAQDCVAAAGCQAPDAIYLTGGSSALHSFQDALRTAFAGVPLVEGDLFGGVAAGLVYSQPA